MQHESARVVVTADETLPFTAYDTVRLPAAGKDEGLPGVFWADDAVRDRFRKLTDLSCPECDGKRACGVLIDPPEGGKEGELG